MGSVTLRRFLAVLLLLGVVGAAARLTAQSPEIKPGPEHEMLMQCAGAWDALVKCPLGESKGTLMAEPGLNRIWLLEHFRGEVGGTKFEGHGATTYDPAKKKYVNVWIDSMSTSPMVSEGTYDKDSKTMTMHGTMNTPDGKSMKCTLTTIEKDANTKLFTITCPGPDGKTAEMMQITYKRRK